jgi:hypothetical protein
MLGYSLSLMPRQDCYITQEPDKNQEKNKENQRRLMFKVQGWSFTPALILTLTHYSPGG